MIRAADLTCRFGNRTAVDTISFDVPAGEIFAFLGPNGAGKTTTIRMLTTLLPVTSGSIEIDGLDPMRQPNEVRRRLGIVFQDGSLDQGLSALENLDLQAALYNIPRATRRSRSATVLKAFDLWDRKDDKVRDFSGGMKRRLEVARALLHTPKVLFLDEPTLGLDPQARNQLWSCVKDMNKEEGVTVFLTTHYMDEADRMATRVAIIDHGRIVLTGTPRQLKEATRKESLEAAYLAIVGTAVREESAGVIDRLRTVAKAWRG
jgi:ABC-2 type transport system ATP-binding protein